MTNLQNRPNPEPKGPETDPALKNRPTLGYCLTPKHQTWTQGEGIQEASEGMDQTKDNSHSILIIQWLIM